MTEHNPIPGNAPGLPDLDDLSLSVSHISDALWTVVDMLSSIALPTPDHRQARDSAVAIATLAGSSARLVSDQLSDMAMKTPVAAQ